jgi:MtN3 and saliva related transmembrane protein
VSVPALLGYLAASCTTLAYVPQVWTILRTRNTAGVSAGMFAVMTLGVLLWLVYGVLVGDRPLILANAISFLLSLSVLVLRLRGGR